MRNIRVEVEGLTFVSHGDDQMTVWAGEPGESKFVSAATIGMLKIDPESMSAEVAEPGDEEVHEVFDEAMLADIARQWLIENPEHRPVTDAQREALVMLNEVVTDVCGDREVMGGRAVLLATSPAVDGLVKSAMAALMNTIIEHVAHGDHPKIATTTGLSEAIHGSFVAGFVAGQTFERRGYRL